MPIIGLRTLEQQVAIAYSVAESGAFSALAFAVLAAILAAAGIFGVVSYSASLRVREIGIRTALGARSPQVLRLIVGDGLRLSGIGALLGVAATFAMPSSMSAILYGVSPYLGGRLLGRVLERTRDYAAAEAKYRSLLTGFPDSTALAAAVP
ncbi:MAG: FtsX-like permease family protein [Gemmatimonadota bacterium]